MSTCHSIKDNPNPAPRICCSTVCEKFRGAMTMDETDTISALTDIGSMVATWGSL
jgi:hypothetical protein